MAAWLTEAGWDFDRDWKNVVRHSSCSALKDFFTGKYSRADFHMLIFQALRRYLVLVGNDEFGHRRYTCEFNRMLRIAAAVAEVPEFKDLPLVYIRFNPHHYTEGGTLYDPPLSERYKVLQKLLDDLKSGAVVPKNPRGLNVFYLFYDRSADGRLTCLPQENYSQALEFVNSQ